LIEKKPRGQRNNHRHKETAKNFFRPYGGKKKENSKKCLMGGGAVGRGLRKLAGKR